MFLNLVAVLTPPPTKPQDVPFIDNLLDLIAFGGLVVSALIVVGVGLFFSYYKLKSIGEEDTAKLADLNDKSKSAIKNGAIGLSGSIVTSILAFFA